MEWKSTTNSMRYKKKLETKRVFDFVAGLNLELDDVKRSSTSDPFYQHEKYAEGDES